MPSEEEVFRGDIAQHIPWITAVVTGPEQQVGYLNQSFLRAFGRAEVPPDATAPGPRVESRTLRARIARVLLTGRPGHIHRCAVHRNGDGEQHGERYMDVWLEPVSRNGEPRGAVILYAVDVTHRVHATRKLRKRFDHHRRLIGTLATTYWASDPQGHRVWEVETRRPLPALDGDGRSVTDAAGSDRGFDENVTAGWLEAVRRRTPFVATRVIAARDGEHALLTRAVPLLAETGEIEEWLGVDIDVTHHLRTSLGNGNSVPGAMEMRVRTMRGFSHDVRNALNAADGYAQLLQARVHGPLTDQQHQSLHHMRGLFQNALDLVTDMLNTERALSGDLEIAIEPTEINAVVTECADGHRGEAELKQLTLGVDLSESAVWTHTDPARVRQILDNLVSNAIKYTPSGSVTIRTGVDNGRQASDRKQWITISVSDTGPGVPPASREAIFDEFVRLAVHGQPGQGLGLAISRRTARMLGGEITLESEPGTGSTFTLRLPCTGDSRAVETAGS